MYSCTSPVLVVHRLHYCGSYPLLLSAALLLLLLLPPRGCCCLLLFMQSISLDSLAASHLHNQSTSSSSPSTHCCCGLCEYTFGSASPSAAPTHNQCADHLTSECHLKSLRRFTAVLYRPLQALFCSAYYHQFCTELPFIRCISLV